MLSHKKVRQHFLCREQAIPVPVGCGLVNFSTGRLRKNHLQSKLTIYFVSYAAIHCALVRAADTDAQRRIPKLVCAFVVI